MSGEHHDRSAIAARVRRVEERLIAAGLTSDDELDGILASFLTSASPLNGARLVARAWTDEGFKERLLADGGAAVGELGLSASGSPSAQAFTVVENTEGTHNVLVCTLCSCYPVWLLGPSPSWYKSEAYRSRVVRDPRGVLAEFGLELPVDTRIEVHDNSSESRHMVLPRRPAGTGGIGEDELVHLVTREGLIGTAAV
jgi:nitrile hydratase